MRSELPSCLLSLFTVRAAQTRTSRRSPRSAYDLAFLLVGLAMHAPDRRQPQRNIGDTLAARVLAELDRRGETLASAESLTGGMVGQLLTDVPGASTSYLGGVISYATRLKTTLAGVDAATLSELGPVAERTAAEMARGVARRCDADWGVSTTGVAGPEAQDRHPVGQVFVAVSHQAGDVLRVEELSLQGRRAAIRQQAAVAALALLADALGLNGVSHGVSDATET